MVSCLCKSATKGKGPTSKGPFGKMFKNVSDYFTCFVLAAQELTEVRSSLRDLNNQILDNGQPRESLVLRHSESESRKQELVADQIMSHPFHKYKDRVRQILEGNDQKIPATPENIGKMVDVAVKHKKAFVCLIKDIDLFEFEDIKHVQLVVEKLYEAFPQRVEEILLEQSLVILEHLFKSYNKRDVTPFVGKYLRMFTKSDRLFTSMMRMEYLHMLKEFILNQDFQVAGDALETFEEWFSVDKRHPVIREDGSTQSGKREFNKFLKHCAPEILEIFADIRRRSMPEEDEESETGQTPIRVVEEEDAPDERMQPLHLTKQPSHKQSSFYTLQQTSKMQYQIMNENQVLLNQYSNDKNQLILSLEMLNVEYEPVQFEAVLLLSIFILMPDTDQSIKKIIAKNTKNISQFLMSFEPKRNTDDFLKLREVMLKALARSQDLDQEDDE